MLNNPNLISTSTKYEIARAFVITFAEKNIHKLKLGYNNNRFCVISILTNSVKITHYFNNGDYSTGLFPLNSSDLRYNSTSAQNLEYMLRSNKAFYESFLNNLNRIRNTNSDLILNEI